MRFKSGIRIVGGAASAVFALAALSVPVAASTPTTRWVDDDGHAGASGCGSSASAFKKVQKAVDASSANDTVVICPGTYVGLVAVTGARTGLTIKGAKPHTAILMPPIDNTSPELDASKNEVSIESLEIVARTGLTLCSKTSIGVVVNGATGVSLDGVEILASTIGDTLGACGLKDGMVVTGGGHATIRHSVVRDFQGSGVKVTGAGSAATVLGSTIEYLHVGAIAAATRSSVPSTVTDRFGVSTNAGAAATVRRTTIRSGHPGDVANQLDAGIYAYGGTITATDDAIRRGWEGIQLWNAASGTVSDNDIRGGGSRGILLVNAIGATVHGNRITGFGSGGIEVEPPSHDNVISGNDARGNLGTDCLDGTTGAKTAGTANTWTNDKGDEDNPDGICSPT